MQKVNLGFTVWLFGIVMTLKVTGTLFSNLYKENAAFSRSSRI